MDRKDILERVYAGEFHEYLEVEVPALTQLQVTPKLEEFETALLQEYGMAPGHPLAKELFRFAWELACEEVESTVHEFARLRDVWKIAVQCGMPTSLP